MFWEERDHVPSTLPCLSKFILTMVCPNYIVGEKLGKGIEENAWR